MDKEGAPAANNATDSILVMADMGLGNCSSVNVALATRLVSSCCYAQYLRLTFAKKLF